MDAIIPPRYRSQTLPSEEAEPVLMTVVRHERINRGLLAGFERRVLRWLVLRLPLWVKPDHLTALGVLGALLVLIGFVGARVSPYYVSLVFVGLSLNWYGDSLDGTLARYREIERPLFGFFIDHSCDLISQTLIFVGLGLSPYFTMHSALVALSMYMLLGSYTYLKVVALQKHQLSYGGVGATELRCALACWSFIAMLSHFDPTGMKLLNYPVLDIVISLMGVGVFLGFVCVVQSDLSRFQQRIDSTVSDRLDVTSEPAAPNIVQSLSTFHASKLVVNTSNSDSDDG